MLNNRIRKQSQVYKRYDMCSTVAAKLSLCGKHKQSNNCQVTHSQYQIISIISINHDTNRRPKEVVLGAAAGDELCQSSFHAFTAGV